MGFYYYDLSGGLNVAESKTALGLASKKITWSGAKNVEIYKNHGIVRQNGNILFCQLPQNSRIVGLFEVNFNSKRYLLIYTAQGALYMRNSATGVLTCLKNDFTACENVCFTKFLGGACISNGIDEPVFFDPSDLTSPLKSTNAQDSNSNNIRGLAMSAFNGRLWIASGSTLYYSALGTYNDWTTAEDAGYISNFHSDYSKITAIHPYREFLAIYKSEQIYFLSGYSEEDFQVQSFANRGVDAHNAVVNANNKQYFFSQGVFNLSQVGELGQIVLSSDVASPIKPLIADYDLSGANKICVVNYELKNQIWFFIPQKNNAYQSEIYIYDYLNNAWTKRVLPQNIICACLYDGKPITASANGKIYIEDTSNSFDGSPINFEWQSPFFSFNTPGKKKNIDDFAFVLDDSYDNLFECYAQKNYESENKSDVQNIKTYNPLNLLWDSNSTVWADHTNGYCWAKSVDCKQKAILSNQNESVQIGVQGDKLTQNCCIIGLEFDELDFY